MGIDCAERDVYCVKISSRYTFLNKYSSGSKKKEGEENYCKEGEKTRGGGRERRRDLLAVPPTVGGVWADVLASGSSQ